MQPNLVLYHTQFCGFCVRVRRAAQGMGIPLELIDAQHGTPGRDRLLKQLGRGTVPVLGIRDGGVEKLLPESRDIIAYLEANQATLSSA